MCRTGSHNRAVRATSDRGGAGYELRTQGLPETVSMSISK